MIKRFGSTGLATILGIGGLLAVGVGSFAAYKSYNGCTACDASKDAVTTPVALTEGAEAASCCAADKAAECATSEGCCEDKAAADCCKGEKAAGEVVQVIGVSTEGAAEKSECTGEKTECTGEKSECTGEKTGECTGEKGEPTAAAEKGSCPLCPSKANG
jgi:hypothetical protein